ncbi:MAG: DNA primase [Mucilaginibacter polytrichastri]|nr:DNA primase [Mucilaginibacter polytrichastri]
MISPQSIERVLEAADIVDVVGEFVTLKRRGANYIGLSPFQDERSPSFNVNPARNIFKDFSSGKGGSVVTFLMEHEKLTYPEAIRWLAKKYNIELEETGVKPEDREAETRRESLFIVTEFAAKFFEQQLWESDEGRSIGLSYFRERGFRDDTIRKFGLGFSPESWDAFSLAAKKAGYQSEFLTEAGLSVQKENGDLYDRFRSRVMFPIHGFTGRVIGFGGRTLKKDKNVPKYVNSPESEIYHKSNVLYGLNFARNSIRNLDNCFLVEGYADVLSVHQAGVENVVASSGTSLTVEQIRLIKRLTKNITLLYDGDAAGIKASLRGLDMLLEEDMDVRVVLFPEGHDPDSYVQEKGGEAFKAYVEKSKKDFILFKTDVLLKESGDDPIKKAEVIRSVVESIAKIPDSIKASVFIKSCSSRLDVDERALLTELNKLKRKQAQKSQDQQPEPEPQPGDSPETQWFAPKKSLEKNDDTQEKEIVRLLVSYGDRTLNSPEFGEMQAGSLIVAELMDIEFAHSGCASFFSEYRRMSDEGKIPGENTFIHHSDPVITSLAVEMITSRYHLSHNWEEKHQIFVKDEATDLFTTIMGAILHLKKRKVDRIIQNIRRQLQETPSPDDQEILMHQYLHLKAVEKQISERIGAVIIK